MSVLLEELVTKISVDTAQLNTKLDKALGKTDKTARKMQASFDKVAKVAVRMGAAIAAAMSVQAIKSAVQSMGQLAEAADRLGLGVERLQELRFAAQEVGVAANQADLGFQRFFRRVAEARAGGGELKATLERLDISLTNANGSARDGTEILKDLADATQRASNSQEQLLIAFKSFDSEGAALVNLLRRGAIGVEEFMGKARELGVVLDEDVVRAGRDMEIAYDRIMSKMGSLWQGTVVAFGEAFQQAFREDAERSVHSLNLELAQLGETLALIKAGGFAEGTSALPSIEARVAELKAILELIEIQKTQPDLTQFGIKPPKPIRKLTTEEEKAVDEGAAEALAREEAAMDGVIAKHEQLNSFLEEREQVAQDLLRAQGKEAELAQRVGNIRKQQVQIMGAAAEVAQDEIDELLRQIDKVAEEELITKELEKAQEAADEFGRALNDAFVDAIFNAKGFGDILESLGKKLLVSALFGGDGKSGALGGAFSKIGGSVSKLFGFAGGGDPPVGVPSVVGEEGPEIFVPKTAGTVVPNGQFGGVSNFVEQHFHFDTTLESVDTRIRQAAAPIQAQTLRALGEASSRNI